MTNAAHPPRRNNRRVAVRSKFISTQQTFSYSFKLQRLPHLRKATKKNSNDGCKNSSKVHHSKRFTSKPIIDWSFPEPKHTYILQHLASHGMHTLDKHVQWDTVTSSADNPLVSKVYSSWNNIDQFAKANQEGTSLARYG